MLRRIFHARRTPGPPDATRARIVRGLAGLAAGASQTRRGSFLIMVVGTLALLAVVTVIYVAVGRADTQTSAAARNFSERDDVPDQVRAYLAGIIADDLFDVYYARERDENGDPLFVREAFDYPSSPFQAVLPEISGGADTPPTFVTVGAGNDERFWFNPTGNYTGTDPWLASSRPTLLNIDASASSETDAERYYLERLDWMQISNPAPDGMFVNLWNLRDAGWDATPWEMRRNLTLYVADPSQSNSRDLDTDYGSVATDEPDERSQPLWWSSRQVWAFHPNVDPVYGPEDPRHMLFQWADADGDGFLDSRWFELVTARDESRPEEARWLLVPDRLRFFIAARVEDLSGRVNVNTATDSTLPPLFSDPYGLTPSAVDLRRALTLQDNYTDLSLGFGYDELEQPKGGGAGGVEDYSQYDEAAAFLAGEKAYDALRMVLDTGVQPPLAGYDGLLALAGGGAVDREFSLDPAMGTLNPHWQNHWKINADLGPTEYFELFAGFGPEGGAGKLGGGDAMSGVGRAFSEDSLLELLRFRAVNDSTERSPLEAALGGRGDPGANNYLPAFSPLRDNRATPLERDGRFTLSKGGATFDPDAKAASAVDIRQVLTTHSGARPIYATRLPAAGGYPSPASLPLDEDDLRENIKELLDGDNLLKVFEVYADALAPYSRHDAHWRAGGGPRMSDTLYYGYRGPELALRTAAHMAINLMDAYDDDLSKAPTARHVIIAEDGTASGPELRLTDGQLAPSSADVLSPVVTMFGIEAQPFITEAASFVMYTDAPVSAGGDNDGDPTNDGDPSDATDITIDGDIASDNPDFLFQCIAFQLHNPFTESIDLTLDAGQYYARYGDNQYFKLVDADNGDAAVTLPGRTSDGAAVNTKVAYYVDPDPDTIASRWAEVTGRTQQEERDRFDEWVVHQFGEGAFRVECFIDSAFSAEVPGYKSDLLVHPAGGVVELYRNDPNVSPADVLADRLRDPYASGTLDRTLPPINHDISGANRDFEGQGDNDGLTITRYASIRRRDDPRGNSSADPPIGGLPAYCVESKSQTYLRNVDETDGSAKDGLSKSDFRDPQGDSTAEATIAQQSDVGNAATTLATIAERPEDKGSDSMSKDTIRGNRNQVPFAGNSDNPPLYVEPHLNNEKFEFNGVSTMRVIDALMPLGIGPHYSLQEGWTTLSEALAYALNYDDFSDPQGGSYGGVPLPPSIYAGAFDAPTGQDPTEPDLRLLDNGFARHDAFMPFFDRNTNGRFDPPLERQWGTGVPHVASLLDRLTTIAPAYGSLRSPTHGQININTAPREVVRLLPGLSPPPDLDPLGSPLWWWGGPTAVHNVESDIATTLVAFRDRLLLYPRITVADGSIAPVNFRDWFDDPADPAGGRTLPPQNGFPPGHAPDENVRHGATGVPGAREGLGFVSLGELAYVRDWAYIPNGTQPPFPHDIDRLGFDGQHVEREGVDPTTYDITGDGIPDPTGDDEIEDDYDERFALVGAALNSVSVRSDIFAVWFVLHGYQESDVKGLDDDDPLIPTIARRFVMVVDRSNVTRPGEKPRILLFKEVPL